VKRSNFNLGWFGLGPLGGLGLAGLLFIGAYAGERREREGAERREREGAERRENSGAWSAAERRADGMAWSAAERVLSEAAERRTGGAAERRADGMAWSAAERVLSGAAERRVRGAAERWTGGLAWSAAERVLSGAAERRVNTIFGSGQEDSLLFVWWNVQNLFDTLPNSGERDRDFLPEGMYRWNSLRYIPSCMRWAAAWPRPRAAGSPTPLESARLRTPTCSTTLSEGGRPRGAFGACTATVPTNEA